MTGTVPERPGMAAAERAGLEQARARAEARIEGLRRSAAEVEVWLQAAAGPPADAVAMRELARRHSEILARLADAVGHREALRRFRERLDGGSAVGGAEGDGRPGPLPSPS